MTRSVYGGILVALFFLAAAGAAEEQPQSAAPVLRLAVDLADGTHLIGVPAITSAAVRTAYANMNIPLKELATVRMADDHETASLDLRNGDKIKGVLTLGPIELHTLFGKVSVDIRHIKVLAVMTGTGPSPKSLVFWNKLGSEEEVLKSEVGPPLTYFEGSGGIEVSATREYVAGKHGKAVTIKGQYQNMSRVRNLVLKDLEKVLNPERGCIEFWYWQAEKPVGYSHGVYRLFDGSYGLGSPIGFHVADDTMSFGVGFGGQGRGVSIPLAEVPNKEWIHLAVVWDRQGIEGSSDTVRLYVNGKKVASANENDWGTQATGQADIGGSMDANCAGKFILDNLKIWDCARSDFNDRFTE